MDAAERLRERAVRLLALAIQVRDLSPDYADKLVAEAVELQDQATAIEEGGSHSRPKYLVRRLTPRCSVPDTVRIGRRDWRPPWDNAYSS